MLPNRMNFRKKSKGDFVKTSDLAQLSFPFTAYWVYTVYTAYTVQSVYIVKTKAFKLLEQVGTLLGTAVELLSNWMVEWMDGFEYPLDCHLVPFPSQKPTQKWCTCGFTI